MTAYWDPRDMDLPPEHRRAVIGESQPGNRVIGWAVADAVALPQGDFVVSVRPAHGS